MGYKGSWMEGGCVICLLLTCCDKGDLYTNIKNLDKQHLPEDRILKSFVQLALALQHMHVQRMLHRDVKTPNILVTTDNDLMLGDFGFATYLPKESEYLTQIVGTPNYMGPELVQQQRYSFPADVWALGCVLVEMATLKPAFEAFDLEGLGKKVLESPPPTLPKQYSEDMRSLVRRLLTKEPSQRPALFEVLGTPFLQPYVVAQQQRVDDFKANSPELPPTPDPERMMREWNEQEQKRRNRRKSASSAYQKAEEQPKRAAREPLPKFWLKEMKHNPRISPETKQTRKFSSKPFTSVLLKAPLPLSSPLPLASTPSQHKSGPVRSSPFIKIAAPPAVPRPKASKHRLPTIKPPKEKRSSFHGLSRPFSEEPSWDLGVSPGSAVKAEALRELVTPAVFIEEENIPWSEKWANSCRRGRRKELQTKCKISIQTGKTSAPLEHDNLAKEIMSRLQHLYGLEPS
eukprot:CAMPEP_0198216744 /NCGR_PEP_ID=MMETSP1445-20131203/59418_1 /TAXON_ID=36898 /ORGANISM="Pyramimonas sp., Strain CCMP2087" /LENGTH=458 /DNA_ID=CAMNT_0043893129 /DNA_START=323 /DNA_END=1699 /DNA_ORIENTATION=-